MIELNDFDHEIKTAVIIQFQYVYFIVTKATISLMLTNTWSALYIHWSAFYPLQGVLHIYKFIFSSRSHITVGKRLLYFFTFFKETAYKAYLKNFTFA